MTDYTRALVILIVSGATIGAALAFQLAGYAPCELCLMQRWPYYAGMPLAAVVTFSAASAAPRRPLAAGFWLLATVFAGSMAFGAYHAGVEWGLWPGPSSCTGGSAANPSSMEEFRQQLNTARVVRCDAVAIRILGLSLAGWNAVISLALAVLALGGALGRRADRRPAAPNAPT